MVLGVNLDDLGDHRPGQRAAAERGAAFPLVDAGFTKADVRAWSKELGLATWDKPAAACLASRLPYGTPGHARAGSARSSGPRPALRAPRLRRAPGPPPRRGRPHRGARAGPGGGGRPARAPSWPRSWRPATAGSPSTSPASAAAASTSSSSSAPSEDAGPRREGDVGHVEVLDDAALGGQLLEARPGHLQAAGHRDVVGDRQQQRPDSASASPGRSRASTSRVGRPGCERVDAPAVVHHPLEHREGPDPHRASMAGRFRPAKPGAVRVSGGRRSRVGSGWGHGAPG